MRGTPWNITTSQVGARKSAHGLTLIEVLLAVSFLSLGLVVMLTAVSRCLGVLKISRSYHTAMWALSAGEAEYPLVQFKTEEKVEPEDFAVSTEEFGGVAFERTVEDPDESSEDNEVRLLVVKTTLSWADRGKQNTESVVRYVLYRENP